MGSQRVEEKLLNENNDWLSPIVNTWNEINSYVPANIKSTIAASLPLVDKPAPREKDFVIATSFDCVPVAGVPHLCLVICFENGFQVCFVFLFVVVVVRFVG